MNIDRCIDFDFVWLIMFSRARKYCSADFDWSVIRKRLLAQCGFWLQIPVGTSEDKTFPVRPPHARSFPSRLKLFLAMSGASMEGLKFVNKLSKLLVFCAGHHNDEGIARDDDSTQISEGTADLLRFLHFVAPYFNPSNIGKWSSGLGELLRDIAFNIAYRTGASWGQRILSLSHPSLAHCISEIEPCHAFILTQHELVLLLDVLLPLCQEAIYSKNGHMSKSGQGALIDLCQIAPAVVAPVFLEFASRALHISSVNQAHQAPAALGVLRVLIYPALKFRPNILLGRLPELLNLSLAGIDCNDQHKTLRTLAFYINVTSWIPIGRARECMSENRKSETAISTSSCFGKDKIAPKSFLDMIGNGFMSEPALSAAFQKALKTLPESSLIYQPPSDIHMQDLSLEEEEACLLEVGVTMSEWSLAFLDRVYDLLRATGEQEKTGKGHGYTSRIHSSSDALQTRMYSTVLKECLVQIFSVMDSETHKIALRSVKRFLESDTLPFAVKDASALCQAIVSAFPASLDELLPFLTSNLSHESDMTKIYRLRCLAGAVRFSGGVLLRHKKMLLSSINLALSSDNKHLFKCGCKILRHALYSQSEAYPCVSDFYPRGRLGESTQLYGNDVTWHSPSGVQLDFCAEMLEKFPLSTLKEAIYSTSELSADVEFDDVSLMVEENGCAKAKKNSTQNGGRGILNKWRRTLKMLRYSLRGCVSILLDADNERNEMPGTDSNAHQKDLQEVAVSSLICSASPSTQNLLRGLRNKFCAVMACIMSLTAQDTFDENASQSHKLFGDIKLAKEITDICELLMTQRGANFRVGEKKSAVQTQIDSLIDYSLYGQVDQISWSLRRAGILKGRMFKDGANCGKIISRRLLVQRIDCFHAGLQRVSSYRIADRLKLESKERTRNQLQNVKSFYSTEKKMQDVIGDLVNLMDAENTEPLNSLSTYESVVDGLCGLSCHSHPQIRSSAVKSVSTIASRFGWLLRRRISRLLDAIDLVDEDMNGQYGIPSCARLIEELDAQGRRKKLAEAIKGVCTLLYLGSCMKTIGSKEALRNRLVRILCRNQRLLDYLPAEDVQKMTLFLQEVFNTLRGEWFAIHRLTAEAQNTHQSCLFYLLDKIATSESEVQNGNICESSLSLEKMECDNETEQKKDDGTTDLTTVTTSTSHWRNRLLISWFIINMFDRGDIKNELVLTQVLKVSLNILEEERGQPLQRVALGLFGKIVALIAKERHSDENIAKSALISLREKFSDASFVEKFGFALAYDHRETGEHHAQWSIGVEDIIRDAGSNVSGRLLFPLQRTGRASSVFKVQHAQLLETTLRLFEFETALSSSKLLLSTASKLAEAPPSEDQKNQQGTASEIFAGVCRALLLMIPQSDNDTILKRVWGECLLFCENVLPAWPLSMANAMYDAIRYAIYCRPPNDFYQLTHWMVSRIEEKLWQHQSNDAVPSSAIADASSEEGFAIQSKLLTLTNAILVELDQVTSVSWYAGAIGQNALSGMYIDSQRSDTVWETTSQLVNERLVPRLLSSLGHPYEQCRGGIAACLYRVCAGRRKLVGYMDNVQSPEIQIISAFEEIVRNADESYPLKEICHAQISAGKFIMGCVRWGDCKFESLKLIRLLPIAFESLKLSDHESSDSAQLLLDAEVIRIYRSALAELCSIIFVSSGEKDDVDQVLDSILAISKTEAWQVRHVAAHFLRCFQSCHKFLFNPTQTEFATDIVAALLADERREVSSAALAALTGILAVTPSKEVSKLVQKFVKMAKGSTLKKKKKKLTDTDLEKKRVIKQQQSVFFLCASVLARPYTTPEFVPVALGAISKHSFERNAPLGVRETVKKCCREYKRTHVDQWDLHRKQFSQEQIEALDDVVSTPHYYA